VAVSEIKPSNGDNTDSIHFLVKRAHAGATRMEAALERHPWAVPILVLTLLAAFGWWFAGKRLLWLDEVATFMTSTRPRSISIMEMLREGVDLTPPLFFEAERASVALLGATDQGIRAPAIAGTLILLTCLFSLVRYWSGPIAGTIALIFSAQGVYLYYLSEARTYGLMLGALGLASLAWQRSENGNRLLKLAAMSLFASLAMGFHYYSVFGLAAIGAGQLGRDLVRRRIDYVVWIALVASVWVLAAHLPLISHLRSVYGMRNPGQGFFTSYLLGDVIRHLSTGVGRLFPLFVLLCWLVNAMDNRGFSAETVSPIPAPKLPLEAWTFFGGAACIVLAGSIASALGLLFYPRYVLFSIVGFSGLSVLAMNWRSRAPALVSMILVIGGGLLLVRAMRSEYVTAMGERLPLEWVRDNVTTEFGPVLSSDIFSHAVLYRYSAAVGLPRIDAPMSRENEIRYRNDPSYTINMTAHSHFVPDLPVRDWDKLRRDTGRFQILRRQGDKQWLIAESLRLGATPRLVRQGQGWELLEVHLPAAARK